MSCIRPIILCEFEGNQLSIVPLQTRDALKAEVIKQGLNIIHSVSFPTDTNPQPFVHKLQVGNWNEMYI